MNLEKLLANYACRILILTITIHIFLCLGYVSSKETKVNEIPPHFLIKCTIASDYKLPLISHRASMAHHETLPQGLQEGQENG
jgi:hypothetical protein